MRLIVAAPGERSFAVNHVTMAATVGLEELTVKLPKGGLTGKVLGPDGLPVPGASIKVTRLGEAALDPRLDAACRSCAWPSPVLSGPMGDSFFRDSILPSVCAWRQWINAMG